MHNNLSLDFQTIQYLIKIIWYSTSSESYIQRSTCFDDSIFDKKSKNYKTIVDKCTIALLYKELGLSHIKQFDDKAESVENDLQKFYDNDFYFLSILNQKNFKKSAFFNFTEKIRNSIAHGTFNVIEDNKVEFLGQFKPNQDSPVNFFMRVSSIKTVNYCFESFMQYIHMDSYEFLKITYEKFISYNSTDKNNLYLTKEGYLLFDIDFEFKKIKGSDIEENHDEQMKQYLQNIIKNYELNSKSTITIILNASSNSMFNKTNATFPNVKIITSNFLLKHFKIE